MPDPGLALILVSLCRLLTVDVGLYLPPYKCLNVYFMKALVAGKKKAIKTTAVRHLYAPQYDTLSVGKLLDFAAAYAAVEEYLPEARDIPLLPRQWVLNVCFTVIGSDFGDFVRAQCVNRSPKPGQAVPNNRWGYRARRQYRLATVAGTLKIPRPDGVRARCGAGARRQPG